MNFIKGAKKTFSSPSKLKKLIGQDSVDVHQELEGEEQEEQQEEEGIEDNEINDDKSNGTNEQSEADEDDKTHKPEELTKKGVDDNEEVEEENKEFTPEKGINEGKGDNDERGGDSEEANTELTKPINEDQDKNGYVEENDDVKATSSNTNVSIEVYDNDKN